MQGTVCFPQGRSGGQTTTVLTIRVTPGLSRRLASIARRNRRTRSETARAIQRSSPVTTPCRFRCGGAASVGAGQRSGVRPGSPRVHRRSRRPSRMVRSASSGLSSHGRQDSQRPRLSIAKTIGRCERRSPARVRSDAPESRRACRQRDSIEVLCSPDAVGAFDAGRGQPA